jgi:hypothetical protein
VNLESIITLVTCFLAPRQHLTGLGRKMCLERSQPAFVRKSNAWLVMRTTLKKPLWMA